MAMTLFFLLNGMGVVFLLFVLVNFWKEGNRPKNAARPYATEFLRRDKPEVVVVTHPISHSAHGGLSVIPMQARERGKQDYRGFFDETDEMPMKTKRFFTR